MSSTQLQAIWELCRQGFPLTAKDAANCWSHGQCFEFNQEYHFRKSLEELIKQSNWEIEKERVNYPKYY